MLEVSIFPRTDEKKTRDYCGKGLAVPNGIHVFLAEDDILHRRRRGIPSDDSQPQAHVKCKQTLSG